MSDLRQTSNSALPDIVSQAELGEDWQMNQMKVDVTAGDESSVLLKLSYGDRVDGYYYLEKGKDIDFQIAGHSVIYEPEAGAEDTEKVSSARFSFVANQTQGTTYTLTFRNPSDAEQEKVTVFLEVIYPVGGSLFFPVTTK